MRFSMLSARPSSTIAAARWAGRVSARVNQVGDVGSAGYDGDLEGQHRGSERAIAKRRGASDPIQQPVGFGDCCSEMIECLVDGESGDAEIIVEAQIGTRVDRNHPCLSDLVARGQLEQHRPMQVLRCVRIADQSYGAECFEVDHQLSALAPSDRDQTRQHRWVLGDRDRSTRVIWELPGPSSGLARPRGRGIGGGLVPQELDPGGLAELDRDRYAARAMSGEQFAEGGQFLTDPADQWEIGGSDQFPLEVGRVGEGEGPWTSLSALAPQGSEEPGGEDGGSGQPCDVERKACGRRALAGWVLTEVRGR